MVEYHGPSTEHDRYQSKFVRVGTRLYVTEPGDTKTQHSELAEQDGFVEELISLRENDPSAVDAGQIGVSKDPEQILVMGFSGTLDLPQGDEARPRTIETFQEQTPTHSVSGF